MNENKFVTQRTHTRLKFKPLTTSCHLVCLTPESPCVQSVNTLLSTVEYEPDRQMSFTVIYPEIRVGDPDGIFMRGAANENLILDFIEWTVNGEPIEDVWNEKSGSLLNDYEIITAANDSRGSLRVYKNIPAGEKAVLHFKGKFLDWRTGIRYNVVSDEIALSSTDKGEDKWSLVASLTSVEYDPIRDDLLEYEYRVARGLSVTGTREDHITSRCYLQTLDFVLMKGASPFIDFQTLGIEMEVELWNGSQWALVELDLPDSCPQIVAHTEGSVTFDMRQIFNSSYRISYVAGNTVLATCIVGLARKLTMPSSGKPMRGADLPASYDWYENRLLVSLADRLIETPEAYYMIKWKTCPQQSVTVGNVTTCQYGTTKTWQRGERMACAVDELGIGYTENDSFFDVWAELEPHTTCEPCEDESYAFLRDENNELLII